MLYLLGQNVVIKHPAFNEITGTIIEIPGRRSFLYYKVKYDQKFYSYTTGLFTEEELELLAPKNILEYVKLRLIARLQ